MIQLTLLSAQASVQPQPDGTRMLVIQDAESGITVVVPFPEPAAKMIGGQLMSGVTIAAEISELPTPMSLVRQGANGEPA